MRRHTSSTGSVNIFAGFLKCEACGYSLVLSDTKGHANHYICNIYKEKGPDAFGAVQSVFFMIPLRC